MVDNGPPEGAWDGAQECDGLGTVKGPAGPGTRDASVCKDRCLTPDAKCFNTSERAMIRPIPILVRHAVHSFANATFPPFPTIRRPRPRHLASFSPHYHSAAIVLGSGFPLFNFLSSHQSHKVDSPRSLLTSLSVIVFACSISTSHYITGIWPSRNPSFNHQPTFTSNNNFLYIQQLVITY